MKGIIFDLDGVLVDSYHCWFQLVNEGLRRLNRPAISLEEFDRGWGQGVEADQRDFFPEWTIEEIIRFYNENFTQFTGAVKIDPDGQRVLKALHERDFIKLAVASNSPQHLVEALLDRADLLSLMDAVVGIDRVKKGKPAPDLLFRAAELLSLAPQQLWYVGDSEFDAAAARAARIHMIGFKRDADSRIESLEDLLQLAGRQL